MAPGPGLETGGLPQEMCTNPEFAEHQALGSVWWLTTQKASSPHFTDGETKAVSGSSFHSCVSQASAVPQTWLWRLGVGKHNGEQKKSDFTISTAEYILCQVQGGAQHIKPLLALPASLLILLPIHAPGKVVVDGLGSWAPALTGEDERTSRNLALAWPTPTDAAIWGMIQWVDNLPFSFSLPLSL